MLIPIVYSGWWIPDSICGFFRSRLAQLKAAWMALRMILAPPLPRANVLIVEGPLPMLVLSCLRACHGYKLVFLDHLKQIRDGSEFHSEMRVSPDLVRGGAVTGAHCVVVQTECLADVFRR